MSSQNLLFLENSLTQKSQIIQNLRNYNDQIQIGYKQSEQNYSQLESQIQDLEKELKYYLSKYNDIANQFDEFKKQNQNQQYLTMKQKYKDLFEQNDFLKKQNKNQQQSISNLNSQIKEQINQHQENLEEISQKFLNQQQFIDKLTQEKEQIDKYLQRQISIATKKKEEEFSIKKIQVLHKEQLKLQKLQKELQDLEQTNKQTNSQDVLKFAECVKQMMRQVLDSENLDDLSVIWRILKQIIQDYEKTKRENEMLKQI